jgi:pimeloyl-ACP methyl ester carboxylesterase
MTVAFMRALLAIGLLSATTASADAAACTAASPDCTQWVSPGESASRLLVYATYPLDKKNDAVTRAVIAVHGGTRDASNNFRSILAAAFLADALDNTIVISPRFAANGGDCKDQLAENELNWPCGGNNWGRGGAAVNAALTSYDLADEILRKLARKENFPNLKTIVFAGHSAGGGFVTRYHMANQVHEQLGVPVTYVIANSSTFTYLDADRPAGTEARPFRDRANCTTFDRWPYGLAERAGYIARVGDDQIRRQAISRPAVFMAGQFDTLPTISIFDTSCPGMAQGPHRVGRAEAYTSYLKQKFAAQHKLIVIPMCAHSSRCIYTSDQALPVLFPKP